MLACLVLLQLLFQEQDGYGCVEDQSISPAEYTAIGIKFITFVRIYFRLMSLVYSSTPCIRTVTCADSEGGQGVRTPSPEKLKNRGFLINAGPDPLKNHKATKPAFNVGPPSARQRNAI